MKFAMIAQAVTMILTFVSKPVIIHLVGIEAHSINSLFTQVISAISLAEMGVGSAIVYNLYKPLAEGDHKKVSELMNLFRTAYLAIGVDRLSGHRGGDDGDRSCLDAFSAFSDQGNR